MRTRVSFAFLALLAVTCLGNRLDAQDINCQYFLGPTVKFTDWTYSDDGPMGTCIERWGSLKPRLCTWYTLEDNTILIFPPWPESGHHRLLPNGVAQFGLLWGIWNPY